MYALLHIVQMRILIVPKQNYIQVTGKLYLGIHGHASAYVLNPIGNGEGSCNMYCISSTRTIWGRNILYTLPRDGFFII